MHLIWVGCIWHWLLMFNTIRSSLKDIHMTNQRVFRHVGFFCFSSSQRRFFLVAFCRSNTWSESTPPTWDHVLATKTKAESNTWKEAYMVKITLPFCIANTCRVANVWPSRVLSTLYMIGTEIYWHPKDRHGLWTKQTPCKLDGQDDSTFSTVWSRV